MATTSASISYDLERQCFCKHRTFFYEVVKISLLDFRVMDIPIQRSLKIYAYKADQAQVIFI